MGTLHSLPTRAALVEHRRRQIEDGFLFPLTATSIGSGDTWTARVRRITLTERATIELIPTDLQAAVMAGLKEVQKAVAEADQRAENQSLLDTVKENGRVLPAADAFCVASFIEPQLVLTDADLATNPDAWVVTDIAAEDRIGWFLACVNAQSEQAKSLKMFRPATPVDVPTGPVGGMAAPTTIGLAEPAG